MYNKFKVTFDCTNENIIDLIREDNPEYIFVGEEPIFPLPITELTVQIITNTKQITYERQYLYLSFKRTMGDFLNWYYRYVQKNEENHIINNSGNKSLFIQGLNEYFNLHITRDDKMDIVNDITYFEAPMDNIKAMHYLLAKTGNILSAVGDDNYLINNGDYFTSCTDADIGEDYALTELVPTFFSNKDNLWVEGKFEKTDNLKEIQQSVVDYLGKLNKVVLKNDENSFFKKEELYDMLLFHMTAMYHYFNNDCKNLTIDVNIGNSEHSENK